MAHLILPAQWCDFLVRRMGDFRRGLRWVRQVGLLIPVAASAFACSGPLAILPGGQISGQMAEPGTVPADWSVVGDYGFFELETRPSDPYSVNIAYTVVGGVLYAYAGATETQWVKNMEEDPRVIIGMEGTLYPLRAARVTTPDEIEGFGAAWTSQNPFHRDPKGSDEVWLYRLGSR